jgi:hypothetical protein
MATILNSVSNLAYAVRQSRVAAIAAIVTMLACVGFISLARAENWEDGNIYDLQPDSSLIALRDRFVRVSGVLARDQVYQSQADVGGLKLEGGRYIPLLIEGMSDPLFVYDANVPAPGADGRVTLVGRLTLGTGAQPPFYIEVGNPPDIPLQNLLARIGIVVGVSLLVLAFVAWLIGRSDYAVSTSGGAVVQLAASGVGALWFGSLGAEFGNAVVRHAPVSINKMDGEIRLDSVASRPAWSVRIRDLRKVAKATIATAYGALPGARIEFQDERGLLRKGTLVIGDLRTQDELGGLLNGSKNWK